MTFFNKERREETRESLVGLGIFGGAILVICSGVLTFVSAVSGVYRATYTRDPNSGTPGDMGNSVYVWLGLAGVLFGVLICLGSIGYALFSEKNRNVGVRRTLVGIKVLARYAVTADGISYSDPADLEFLETPKLYVRLISSQDGSVEYECSEEVFMLCGEGMTGDAEIQGGWIGAFHARRF